MIPPAIRTEVESAVGAKLTGVSPIAGGDINEAYKLNFDTGASIFLKRHPNAPDSMFQTEALGLEWLAEPGTLIIPKVIHVGQDAAGPHSFLALEMLQPGQKSKDFWEIFGQGLANLHRSGCPNFGLEYDNFIGRLAQPNKPTSTWPEFFRVQRLEAQVNLAQQQSLMPKATRLKFDRIYAKLESLVGPTEPPARLHGDLWSGNLHQTSEGAPALIDPAVYGGHREMDLAMMRLFGGFSERAFDAYHATYPLSPDHRTRIPLWQLYPLLVHLNLFGTSYLGGIEAHLERYL